MAAFLSTRTEVDVRIAGRGGRGGFPARPVGKAACRIRTARRVSQAVKAEKQDPMEFMIMKYGPEVTLFERIGQDWKYVGKTWISPEFAASVHYFSKDGIHVVDVAAPPPPPPPTEAVSQPAAKSLPTPTSTPDAEPIEEPTYYKYAKYKIPKPRKVTGYNPLDAYPSDSDHMAAYQ